MKHGILAIICLIFLSDACDTVSQLTLKSSINSLDLHVNTIGKVLRHVIELIRIPRVWVGFFFSCLSLILWLFVLSKADLNFAYSLDSMRYLLIALASAAILKENIGTTRWLGITSVVCGIMLVVMG